MSANDSGLLQSVSAGLNTEMRDRSTDDATHVRFLQLFFRNLHARVS